MFFLFFCQAEDGIRDYKVTGVQTCALPIYGRWIGVPQFIVSWAVTYREDWFKEAGFEYPKTWDEFRKVGRAFKTKGRPFGQAFGHSINDPNAWAYPIVWMWGGLEAQKDGRSVPLNSKNTVEAAKVTLAVWKDRFD